MLFSSSFALWVLISLSSTIISATIKKSPLTNLPIECNRRWSTEDIYPNQDSVSCDCEKKHVCNVRTCHMGGRTGSPDGNPVNKQLFLDNCAKIAHNGTALTPPKYRIFPRSYEVSHRDIIAHGFAPFEAVYEMATFKCAWNQATNINSRRVWCRSCSAQPARE